jgi:tetratricopeptide (TPR) repeat protein
MAKSNILIRSKLKKAQQLFNENKLAEAKVLYEQIYNSNRNDSETAIELAIINRKLGQFNTTHDICKNILASNPNNAIAHHILGSALQCLGNMDAAITEYKTAIQLDNKLVETHYFLGNIYRLVGKLELAAESFANALKLNPDFFEALNNYGAILVELHRPVEAREVLNKAMSIDPNSNQVLCNFASYFFLENNSDEAYYYAKKAYVADPNFVDSLKLLGKIHYKRAEYDKSLEFYRQAYKFSKDIEIIGAIADILERRSEFDEAFELVKPLIDTGNTNPAILLTYSALSRKYGTQKTAIESIERKLASENIEIISRVSLHSELGKQYDALKEYDKAFLNYKQANLYERELNKQILDVVQANESNNNVKRNSIDQWFTQYNKSFWESLPRSSNTSERPIFVIGMFRSGTTLCEQILSSHPDVHGAGELNDIHKIYFTLDNSKTHDKSPAPLTNVTKKQLADAAEKYLATLNEHSTTAKRVVDKMPSNFSYVGLISLMFPNARIIHMIRDPRDVCLSMYFQRFGPQMTFSTDLEELADYHLAYQAIMKYWHEVLDIPILDVVYEDLVENQEAMTRKMIDFCGLEWDDKCLSFYENKRDINTPSYDQVRKPMYKKSVARWKHYEKHLEPLINRLGLADE